MKLTGRDRIVRRERGIRQTNTGAWTALEVQTRSDSVVPGRQERTVRVLLGSYGGGEGGRRLATREAGTSQVIA